MSGNLVLDIFLISITFGLAASFLSFAIASYQNFKNNNYDCVMLALFMISSFFAAGLSSVATLTIINY
ncbi:hypothetical protein [Psittacicella hinzii]|uniref:Uncharacterized protein n=1 Tax=Psittacicella hinzii TaxID=2028575 RepID=A0A3A1YGV7_9GAMM|nr:hypothetical protein [Psittacicella hinzii]RIY37473.1 hypothetical protein CKF58_04955 [Psittacicella hinzii]